MRVESLALSGAGWQPARDPEGAPFTAAVSCKRGSLADCQSTAAYQAAPQRSPFLAYTYAGILAVLAMSHTQTGCLTGLGSALWGRLLNLRRIGNPPGEARIRPSAGGLITRRRMPSCPQESPAQHSPN